MSTHGTYDAEGLLPRFDLELPIVAFDTETALFAPGAMAPPLVCVSYAPADAQRETDAELYDRRNGLEHMRKVFRAAIAGEHVIAGQNITYDLCVLAAEDPTLHDLIFDALAAGRIYDTMIAEWLLDTAEGLLRMEWDEEAEEWKSRKSYGLENLTRIYLNWPFYKDEWRLRYAELAEVPVEDYPVAAALYPRRDALGTLQVAQAQLARAERIAPHNPLAADLAAQCRAYHALGLVSAWGMELDPHRVQALYDGLEQVRQDAASALIADGFLHRQTRGKAAGKLSKKQEPIRAAVAADYAARGLEAPLTKGGKTGTNKQISFSASALKDCTSPELQRLARFVKASTMQNNFATPLLRFGRGPIHPRYAYADTGRTTCSGGSKRAKVAINVQQLPKSLPAWLAHLPDVRSAFVARPGCVLSSTDYTALEMYTHAQVLLWMFGGSVLADALNRGIDPHTLLAAREFLRIDYEAAVPLCKIKGSHEEKMRTLSKVPNFGLPGGMGAARLVAFARDSYDLVLGETFEQAIEAAKELKRAWIATFPEMADYLRTIADHTDTSDTIVQYVSGRIRSGVGYSDAANGFFQGLAADGAKDALWHIERECYDHRLRSPLYGSRVLAFVHDEFVAEHPRELAHEAATRLGEIAVERMWRYTPDVKPKAEPALMLAWSKKAETVRDANGRLVPYDEVL